MRYWVSSFAALALAAAASGQNTPTSWAPGLIATYSDGAHRVQAVAETPNFYLEAGESVHPSLAPSFQAEWSGSVSILQSGTYTFEAGGAEVSINGAAAAGKPIALQAGRHPIVIRYRRAPGTASLQLRWLSSHFPLEPVPGDALAHAAGREPAPAFALAERGRLLAEEFGCVNCHAGAGTVEGRPGPDLSGIGSRVKAAWLQQWLASPTAFRSGAVMPAVAGASDRRDLTAYLMSLQQPAQAKPAGRPRESDFARGNQLFGTLGCNACHQQEGLSLEGMGSKTTAPVLAEYLQDPARFDPGGRMPSFLLSKGDATQLALYLTTSRNPEFEKPAEPGDAARGRELVGSLGCTGCHTLPDAAPGGTRAPRLEALQSGRGCLADTAAPHVPRYRFSAGQRAALEAFLSAYRAHPDRSPAPVHRLELALEQYRCIACHKTGSREATAALPEAAPPLTGAGGKLRTAWLGAVITGRERIRGWQELRMPQYDARRVAFMAPAFAKAAGVEPGGGPPSPHATDAHRTRGAGMIGSDPRQGGMACTGCHDWGKYKSTGEEGPQLINTARRLRYDWYSRWMLNPARILSGTSMPNYFGSLPPARAAEAINALWAAFEMGENMPLPAGLEKSETASAEARPVPGREAVVVRWDMPEATPDAIAVGLPGGISYCFDAGESRLRYAWHGGFLDMAETLHRKVDANRLTPTAKLMGEIFFRSTGFPFRTGQPDRVPQRRFRGYRIVEGIPRFHYQIDGIDVYERLLPSGGGLTREFTVARVDRPLWFVEGGQTREIARGSDVRFSIEIPRESK